MDRRDARKSEAPLSDLPPDTDSLTSEVLEAFVRMGRGDLSVRVARNYTRDSSDTLAYFVNIIAEELGRLLAESEANRQRLEGGVAELNELLLRVAAGDFSARSSRTGAGDPLDVLGSLFDNTVAKLGDSFGEVERQRATLAAIFDSMADAMFLLDEDGRIERTNEAARQLLGRPTLEGMMFAELLSPRELSFASTLAGQLIEPFRARDTNFVDVAGNSVILAVNGSPLQGADNRPGGIVLTARDDRELRKAQAQLRLSDRMATMGTLSAGVAHEINNPLSFVLSNLEFALEELGVLEPGTSLDEDLHDELVRALETSRKGAERVATIVGDLKSISRVDEETTTEIDIRRVLDSASAMLRNEIRHRARLVRAYEDVPIVRANEARLLQVALNLIQNAAHAIPVGQASRHQITLETRTDADGCAVFAVTDTGSGIAAESLDSIFETFFTTKPVGEGTGLGLSISKRLVDEMNGRIEVESAPGQGTTFRVVLPGRAAPAVRSSAKSLAPRSGLRRNILVVDDEREIGESVRRLFRSEHDVDIATSGPEALALFADKTYDLVLVDLMMPDMSGSDFCTELDEQFPRHQSQVILMSGGSLGAIVSPNSLEHITKPFAPGVLRRLLDALGQAI